MAISLALIILLGLTMNKAFTKFNLPGLLGMLILGIIIGPHGLNLISSEIMTISPDLRKIALIVILLRAGLGLEKKTLLKIGVPALKMSFIPVLIEGAAVLFAAHWFLKLSIIESGMLAFIIAAVSPAVIVPQMLDLIDRKIGTKKGIPSLILAGASIDDVTAITLFSTFLGLYSGKHVNIGLKILNIPVSLILGIALGAALGMLLLYIFKALHLRTTKKALLLLSFAILLTGVEEGFKSIISIASLLGVMSMGFIIMEKSQDHGKRLAVQFNRIWVAAEIMLFVLVGAEVDVPIAIQSGLYGILIIGIGLGGRTIGVFLSLLKTELNMKERLFCAIAYTPKATVQAAIAAVPLAAGVPNGEIILAIGVLSIIITAPLGLAGIKTTSGNLLTNDI